MNILFASPAYIEPGKASTGLPNYLKRISIALKKMGHTVFVVYASTYDQEKIENDIYIICKRIPYTQCDDTVEKFRNDSLLVGYILHSAIREICNKRCIDIIQYASLRGIACFHEGIIPAVMRLSSYSKIACRSNRYTSEEIDIRLKFENLSSKNVDRVYAPSIVTAKAFEEDNNIHVDVIETPFENDVSHYDFSYYDTYLKDKRYVLFFGAVYHEKGIFVISEIIAEFLRSNKEYYFVVIGDELVNDNSEPKKVLIEKSKDVADRIVISNSLQHKCLYPVIMNASFVILPSLMDNFPNACIEAMYFNRIVIGTEGTSFEQLIKNGRNGFLCIPGDSASLLQVMTKVVHLDKDEKKYLEYNAKKRVEMLSPEFVVKDLIQYYEDVIEQHNYEKNNDITKYEEMACGILDKNYSIDMNKTSSEYSKLYLQKRLMRRWIFNKTNDIHIKDYINIGEYDSVAIYGMGDIGLLLFHELVEEGIKVKFVIENRRKILVDGVSIISSRDKIPKVDIIIITPIDSYIQIVDELKKKTDAEIVSIERIIFGED